MSEINDNVVKPSVLEVAQQFLAGEDAEPELVFKLGRACAAHCMAAARELMDDTCVVDVADFIDFVDTHGAKSGSDMYVDGQGWNLTKLADLLRLSGHSVVAQNILTIDHDNLDIKACQASGRVKSDYEKSALIMRSHWAGNDRARWPTALRHTLDLGGVIMASITVPLLSGDGTGRHAVLITDIDEDASTIDYFDPDYYNLLRYGQTGSAPTIQQIHSSRLIYRRPLSDHLHVMTGEVSHIYPARGNHN